MSNQAALKIIHLTPPGRGAVAAILVEGTGAIDVVQRRFHSAGGRPLTSYPPGRLVFGRFDFGGHAREEVVVHVRGSESVEVCCHGGTAAVAAVETALIDEGGVPVAWHDWAVDDDADKIAAAARVALADASTRRAALVLLDQFHGSLRRAVKSIASRLDHGDAASAAAELNAVLAQANTGRHLTEPWRVVLAGPPNVGKSSLINALVGYRRAIVHPTPGTTRDVVTAATAMDGWPVELSDTAGLRVADEKLEQAGIALAHGKLAEADLVVLVFDSTRPWSDDEAAIVNRLPQAVVVHNKQDLATAAAPPRPKGLRTSALCGEGIDALINTIATRLVPYPPSSSQPVPFTTEQIDHLRAASDAIERGNLRAAREEMTQLL